MDRLTNLYTALAALPQLTLLRDEPMSRHTTFRTGGPAALWAQPNNAEALTEALRLARAHGVEPVLLGAGSNVLAPDEGLDTLVIQLKGMAAASVEGNTLTAEAGISLRRLAVLAQEHGLTGLEFAHGIPGTLGGAIYMNAGAYGGEIKDVVTCVTGLFPDGSVRTLCNEDLDFGYRHSAMLAMNAVALSATLTLQPGDPEAIATRMAELQAKRTASQPLEYPSAGSTFKRPAAGYAAAMIDETGLKGLSVGGAQVSEKHAGFVINRGEATTNDILALMQQVQQRVFDRTGVLLEPEVRILPRYKGGVLWNS